jgi:hypothetical protein
MNKTLSLLAALLVITSATIAKTPDNPASSISLLKKGETIRLLYKSTEPNDVKILILNEDNQIVFTEKIRATDGFIRPYNFSQLPQGNYSIALIDSKGRQTEQVNYRIEQVRKLMHVVRVSGTKDKFVLSVPNEGESKLSVTIYDDMNRVLYNGKENVAGDFARMYNLKDHVGKVTFEVSDSQGRTNSLTRDIL